MDHSIWWIGFGIGVFILLALDLGVFNRKSHEIKMKEALLWSAFWIFLALAFNVFVYFEYGHQQGIEFLTAYFIEKSLSIDNLFVFVIIFSYFNIPARYQHKVLFWGIVGALAMRLVFIFAGVALINKFHWIIYVFGVMLLYSGYKMFKEKEKKMDIENNSFIKLLRKIIPVNNELENGRFFIRKMNVLFATPLFVALVMIEATDVIFAVDSIPAVLAISKDTFIIYSSNIMAILGLRSLYFALSSIMKAFSYLHYGLSIILVFVGCKMMLTDIFKIEVYYSLLFIILVIAGSIFLSLREQKLKQKAI
jgi:tellurite resistance protein TerC